MRLNIPKNLKKSGYRHGDLRRALLEVARSWVSSTGNFDFTIQDLSERIGVSRAAAYRYFKSPQEILEIIAIEGFQELHAAMKQADSRDIGEIGKAYMEFVARHPADYRVMFTGATKGRGNRELDQAADATFRSLVSVFGGSRKSVLKAIYAWSLVHGLAMLQMDGSLCLDKLIPNLEFPEIEEFFVKTTRGALKKSPKSAAGATPRVSGF